MALKQPNIEKASNETRRAMERASAYSLPNNPSERGMKPDDLKKAFWEAIHGSSASILKEQDRIVDAINEYLLAFYDFIGNGDVLSPGAPYDEQIQEGESGLTMLANVAWRVLLDHMQQTADTPTYPTKDPHGTHSAIQRHNSSGDAHNEIRTKINRKIEDDISTHNNDSNAHIDLRNNVNQNAREIADASNDIENIFADIGDSVLLTEAENVKSAINEVYSLALTTDETANTNRVNLVGVMAQILGIAKSYVIDSFLNFIEFINGRFTIPIFEDRDGDGIRETYEVDITYLRTGDNVLIVEQNVPDMWFEASGDNAGGALETYEYDGVEYSLIAKDETGEIVGVMHIAETDYTVIEGHALSAAASAEDAKKAKEQSREYFEKVEKISNSIYTVQVAPPLSSINEAIILETPTLDQLFDKQEGG